MNHAVNDVWSHARFGGALNVVANALLQRRYLTERDVTEVIEGAIGADMRPAPLDPDPEHIRVSAFYDYTRRQETGEIGTPVGDWLISERALRYALS